MLINLQRVLYVQLSPKLISLRDPKTAKVIAEVPELALTRGAKRTVVGLGAEARLRAVGTDIDIVNPFAHPRSLVSDFTVGELVLKLLLRRMNEGAWLALAPTIVMHPQGEPEGGYTQIELRALREMAMGAGAARVAVWVGRGLSDQELLEQTFPSDGGVLA